MDMGTGDHREAHEGNQGPADGQAGKGCIPNRCIEEQTLGLMPVVQREQDAEQEAGIRCMEITADGCHAGDEANITVFVQNPEGHK
jgi:hypothetical protein